MAQKLLNLQPATYEHPFDREALKKVNAVPGLATVMNFALNWIYIKRSIIALCGSNFHVTRTSCSDLYTVAHETWDTLDLNHIPDLYIIQDYSINAYTTGHQKDAYIVLSSGTVDKLNDKELQFVIGHESGHIKSNHVLYHIICAYASMLLSKFGIDDIALSALKYWNRMSEFTADRAGLLACQDLDAALSAIMKMSGLPETYYKKASLQGFIQQTREFDEKYGGTSDAIFKFLEIFDEDHPWTIVRAAELIRWVESGQYQKILDETQGKMCPVCNSMVTTDSTECQFCGYKF